MKAFKLTALAFAITAAMSTAEAATPVSYYNYATTIKSSTTQMNFIKSMETTYTKAIATYSTLVTDSNTAKWGTQAWYQSIVEQYNWYKAELAKYQALETSLTGPAPATTTVSVDQTQPGTVFRTIDATKLEVGATPQMYLGTSRPMTLEQFQSNTVLTQVGIPAAWARGWTGKGSTIAVIDQGFNVNHADLTANIKAYKNFYTGSITDANANWGLHGTAMASVAAGVYNGMGTIGVAPDAQLLLAQVGQGGKMPNIDMSAAVNALNWAGTQGAIVANMSFSSSFDPTYISGTKQIAPGVYQGLSTYGPMYGQLATYNLFKGSTNTTSVVVAAAGNQGLAYSGFPGAFATQTDANGNLTFGGRWLIVGSVDANNKLSTFSNAAGHICTNVVNGACQDTYQVKDFYVVAPGEKISVAMDRSSANETVGTFMSGTSPATAIVAGGVAVIHQAWPQLKAAEIVQLIKSTATDLGAPGVDEVYGYGLVNFDKATQPYADVKYSKVQLKSGTSAAGTSLNTTGITTSGSVTTALQGSQVLKSVQIVDSINRNFTADFTRGVAANKTYINSFSSSPWLAMKANYHEATVPFSKTGSLTLMQSDNGFATQVTAAVGANKLSLQVGAMNEQSGFLNNTGAGLFGMGNSSTTYAMVGGSMPIADKTELIGNYGLGLTKTSNAADSLLSLSPTIVSDSWKLGVARSEVFFTGKTKDQFTVALQGPVSIRKGHADVTAVTGYTYSGDEFDVTATPVTSTERVNLATGTRPMDLVMGYIVSTSNMSMVGVNVARQFNIGGQPGATGNAVNIMARVMF